MWLPKFMRKKSDRMARAYVVTRESPYGHKVFTLVAGTAFEAAEACFPCDRSCTVKVLSTGEKFNLWRNSIADPFRFEGYQPDYTYAFT